MVTHAWPPSGHVIGQRARREPADESAAAAAACACLATPLLNWRYQSKHVLDCDPLPGAIR